MAPRPDTIGWAAAPRSMGKGDRCSWAARPGKIQDKGMVRVVPAAAKSAVMPPTQVTNAIWFRMYRVETKKLRDIPRRKDRRAAPKRTPMLVIRKWVDRKSVV